MLLFFYSLNSNVRKLIWTQTLDPEGEWSKHLTSFNEFEGFEGKVVDFLLVMSETSKRYP